MPTATISVHVTEDATYWATIAEYPGVFATGDDLDELRESLEEGVSLYLADDEHPEQPAPTVTLAPLTLHEQPQAIATAQLAIA